ncbi:MAG: response regulator [Nitrospirae bacterium]|nr:response regulator [Nitrospirota bacterium]
MPAQILVVDQNPIIQTTIENTLIAQNFEVTCVRDALSGLDLAYKIKPDLIIADMRMEGLMIYSFCARIRQKTFLSHIPIFLLVQQNDGYDEAKLRQSGVVGFLKKPFDEKELKESLKPYLARFSDNFSDTVLSPPLESPVRSEMIEKPEEAFNLDQTVFEKTVMDSGKAKTERASVEETVNIEDLLGWSADEVSPFSEVISSPAPEETEGTGLTKLMEESAPSDTTVNPFSADTQLDTLQETSGITTDFEATTTNFETSAFIEEPVKNFEEVSPISIPSGGKEADMTKITQEIIEKVAWEVVPHLTEQALKKEAIAAMVEKVIWEVVPFIAEKSVKEAIKKITEELE